MIIHKRVDLPMCPFCKVAPVEHPSNPDWVRCSTHSNGPTGCPLNSHYTHVTVWRRLGNKLDAGVVDLPTELEVDIPAELLTGPLIARAAVVGYWHKDRKIREGAGAMIFRGERAVGLVHRKGRGTVVWHQHDIDVPLRASTMLSIGAFMRRFLAEIETLEECHRRHPSEPILEITVQYQQDPDVRGAIHGS